MERAQEERRLVSSLDELGPGMKIVVKCLVSMPGCRHGEHEGMIMGKTSGPLLDAASGKIFTDGLPRQMAVEPVPPCLAAISRALFPGATFRNWVVTEADVARRLVFRIADGLHREADEAERRDYEAAARRLAAAVRVLGPTVERHIVDGGGR